MPSITAILSSLGNAGAVANVRIVLDDRVREDWLVAGLTRRLAERDRAGRTAPADAVAAAA